MKHTPGPWTIERADDLQEGYVSIDAPSHGALAQVVWKMEDDERSPTCEANARLIAAAPDLLAAAQIVLAGLNARIRHAKDSTPVFDGIAALHAAIAKATSPSEDSAS